MAKPHGHSPYDHDAGDIARCKAILNTRATSSVGDQLPPTLDDTYRALRAVPEAHVSLGEHVRLRRTGCCRAAGCVEWVR